jgi:hypothetical protein
MFDQILLEIEQELGIDFGPVLYCPNTFNPMKSVFNNGTVRHHIDSELINSSTWAVLMGTEGPYIYDVCVKTLIKDSVIKTMVRDYSRWGVTTITRDPHEKYYTEKLIVLSMRMGVPVETLVMGYGGTINSYMGISGKSGLVKFEIKKHTL